MTEQTISPTAQDRFLELLTILRMQGATTSENVQSLLPLLDLLLRPDDQLMDTARDLASLLAGIKGEQERTNLRLEVLEDMAAKLLEGQEKLLRQQALVLTTLGAPL